MAECVYEYIVEGGPIVCSTRQQDVRCANDRSFATLGTGTKGPGKTSGARCPEGCLAKLIH